MVVSPTRALGMATKSLEEVFAHIRDGRMVVMVAEEHEDAEGDLVMAAEKITPDHVNFLAREARGIVSVAITDKRMRELGIPLSHSTDNGSSLPEQAGALIDAREGATTGISAADRSRVIQIVASPECGPEDIVMPGHILPLMSLSGGVMMRMGRAEGAVDLVRSAGLDPAAALCTILRDDGEAAQLPELREFAAIHSLPLCIIRDLVSYRLTNEILVRRVAESDFSVREAELRAIVFRNIIDGHEHLAL